MKLQRMLGHITTLVPKTPTKVLVIGCGAGVTAGAVSIDPLVKDQTIAEIEPLVPRVVSTHFAQHNFGGGQSQSARPPGRRPSLSADDRREIRRGHV
jgi:spermidine synthase